MYIVNTALGNGLLPDQPLLDPVCIIVKWGLRNTLHGHWQRSDPVSTLECSAINYFSPIFKRIIFLFGRPYKEHTQRNDNFMLSNNKLTSTNQLIRDSKRQNWYYLRVYVLALFVDKCVILASTLIIAENSRYFLEETFRHPLPISLSFVPPKGQFDDN